MMTQRNVSHLIEKWSGDELGKLSVAGIEDQYIKENVAIMLENQSKPSPEFIAEASQASTTNVQGQPYHQPIAMALVRRTFPALFANKTVGVQALQGPVGLAYALRVLYADGNGNEAAWDVVPEYSGYTGNPGTSSSAVDTGTGAPVLSGEAMNIGDTTGYPNQMNELIMKIERIAIEAKTRKLAASFSLEAAQDIKATQGIEVEREMVNYLHYEIQAELDREILQALKTEAVNVAQGGAILPAYVMSAADGRWSQEKYSNLVTQIIKRANDIALSTRRGAGNFVVVSPRVATALQACGPMFDGFTKNVNGTTTLAEIGVLNGSIKVYRDSYATKDYFLVGYKGPGISDCGVIFSPYIMGLTSRAVAQEDFSSRIGVMSRYAMTNSLLGSGRYYRYQEVEGLEAYIG